MTAAMHYEVNTSELPSEEELGHLFSQTTWAASRRPQDIKKLLETMSIFVTIRENSELVGFGRAISDGIYRALIDDIIVDVAYQKRGLGRVILESLLEQLQDIQEIFLNTSVDLEQFYNKFGFGKAKCLTMKK